MCEPDQAAAVVLDLGSGYVRAGWAEDDAPKAYFPTVVARPKSGGKGSCVIGDTSQSLRAHLNFQYPMEHGIVTDWDDMEKILHHTFNQLRLCEDNPLEHSVLMSDAPLTPMGDREKMTQLMFEKFQVPGFYVSNDAILSIYASGRVPAMCVSCGHGVTHVLSVSEYGYCNRSAVARLDLGGRDLNLYLGQLLGDRGYSFHSSGEHQILQEMKEKKCYVASDFSQQLATPYEKQEYMLPDGQVITLTDEMFKVPEALFRPSLLGLSSPGLHELVYGCLMAQDIDLRPDYFGNIVVAGGSTMCPGFADRLQKELKERISPTQKVRVVAMPERRWSVWIGGSILASLSAFQQRWFTRQEYQEWGPSLVHRKCPI